MASQSATKQQRNKVDYSNVVLALPAHFPSSSKKRMPRAAGEKGATTSRKTTTGQREKRKAAPPSDGPTEEGQRKNRKAATMDAVTTRSPPGIIMEQHNLANTEDILKDSTEPNVVNNEQLVLEEQSGTVHQQNLANAREDILPGDPTEPKAVNNEGLMLEEQPGFGKKPDSVNNEHPIQEYTGIMVQQNIASTEDILKDSTEPNVVNNEQLIPEEQSGIVHQQNLANATEDILPGDPAEEANVVNNEEPIVEDQAEEANVVNNEEPIVEEQGEEGNVDNNEEPIVEEQAGIIQQENLADAQQHIPAAEDPAVMDDIFEFPLNNQLLDDIDFQLNDDLD